MGGGAMALPSFSFFLGLYIYLYIFWTSADYYLSFLLICDRYLGRIFLSSAIIFS